VNRSILQRAFHHTSILNNLVVHMHLRMTPVKKVACPITQSGGAQNSEQIAESVSNRTEGSVKINATEAGTRDT
jgi:hypothetical protein